MLTHLIANHCGLEAYEFVHFMGNCHLYENSIDLCSITNYKRTISISNNFN